MMKRISVGLVLLLDWVSHRIRSVVGPGASLLLLLNCAGTASAKLGETVEEVEVRYGKAQQVTAKETEEQRTYDYEGYAVQVCFVNGKSAYELILATKDPGKISDVESLAFARALSGRDDWMVATKGQDTTVWLAPGFKMLKCNSATDPEYVGVYTMEYWNKFRAKKSPADAAAEKAILEKFGSPSDTNPGAVIKAKAATKPRALPAPGYAPAAETYLTFTNRYGTVFNHVKVAKILPDGILYYLDDGTGGGKIDYTNLPAESQESLRYDPTMVKARAASR